MFRFLSRPWLDECHRLGSELPERVGASARIQYVVEGSEGAVPYWVAFTDGRISASELGEADGVDATLRLSYADSASICQGELDPNAAFAGGQITFEGDMRALMSLMPILWPNTRGRLGSAVRYRAMYQQIRDVTEYG